MAVRRFVPPQRLLAPHRRRGFALLITITLLAFLVLLLVSLASLTRVETQVATNNQQLAQARQNALMALNIAMGQLQRYAGPDQRVTAPADLIATTDKAGAAAPAVADSSVPAHKAVSDGARYWTGIWGNGQAIPSGYTDRYKLPPDKITGRGVTPVQLNWLVSGNEKATYTADPADGSVTAGTAPSYGPDAAIANLSGATATSTNITVNTNPATLLVGPNSLGASASLTDYVAAPLVDIKAAAGTVPGLAAAATPTIGRYAYWVGDDGVKARINLQNGYQKTGVAADRINSFITSQRSAIELMDRDAVPNTLGASYSPTNAKLPKLVNAGQLPLIGTTTTNQNRLSAASKIRFHDLTAASAGVLSDTYAGSLKKDLTADIADTSSTSSYRPADSDPIFTPLNSGEPNLPTWGHLRSWARRHPVSGGVDPVPPSATEAGFSPMITYASIGLKLYVEGTSNPTASPTTPYTIKLALYPVVVLSNPYPVTIKAANYDIGFKLRPGSSLSCRWAPAATGEEADAFAPPFDTLATLDLGTLAFLPGATAGTTSDYISFRIQGSDIPPGETHIYQLASSEDGLTYIPGRLLTLASPNVIPNRALLVSSSFPITNPAVTNDARFVVLSENVSYCNQPWPNDKIQAVLSRQGGLNNPSDAFQTYEMIMSDRGIMAGAHVFQTRPVFPAKPISLPLTQWPSSITATSLSTTGATSAIRISSPLEARGNFNDLGVSGMAPFGVRPWLRMGNLRAPYSQPTWLEINGDAIKVNGQGPWFFKAGSTITGALLCDAVSGVNTFLMSGYNAYTANTAGRPDATTPARYATLFDLLDSPDRLLSLGQLQHVPFSRYSFYPSYPFANSMAPVHIDRTSTYRVGLKSTGAGPGVGSGVVVRPLTETTFDPAYDISWCLNRALWDKYFVSGIPSGVVPGVSSALTQSDVDANKPLPNARLVFNRENGAAPTLNTVQATSGTHAAYDQAAAHLMVSGAFNINSTSEQAWRAILGGTLGLSDTTSTYSDSGDNVGTITPYARFSRSLTRSSHGAYSSATTTMQGDSGNENALHTTMYHGNRGLYLNDSSANAANSSASDVVKELARTMVQEIRRRGPFLSLADFVNRPIYANKQDAGIKGAIQTAIDTTQAPGQVNPTAAWNSAVGGGGLITNTGNAQNPYPSWDDDHYLGGPASEIGTGRDSFRFTFAFAPKYLTQADILSTLGPLLAARSDTFTVRTYGETRNPATDAVEGRAWCEAVVQRLPDYVNTAATPNAWDAPTGTNLTFGRQFKIVSFRWLSPSDI